jgi:hypothetical protein
MTTAVRDEYGLYQVTANISLTLERYKKLLAYCKEGGDFTLTFDEAIPLLLTTVLDDL